MLGNGTRSSLLVALDLYLKTKPLGGCLNFSIILETNRYTRERTRGEREMGEIELWSEVITGLVGNARRDVLEERVFRKNSFVAGSGENKVTGLVFGGSRMFVTRKDQQAVEVWQSSSRGVSM